MNEAYAAENTIERQRLVALTTDLTEAELTCPLGNGWTVAGKLMHLAFWDRYYLALIKTWEQTGFAAASASVAAINDAVRQIVEDIPPRAAVQVAQAAADAIDRKLEALAPELATAIEAGGHVRILRRALHRREHLDQIETAIGTSSCRLRVKR